MPNNHYRQSPNRQTYQPRPPMSSAYANQSVMPSQSRQISVASNSLMSSNKPKSRSFKIRSSNVIYEGDVEAIKRRLIPSNVVDWIVYAICAAVIVWALIQLGFYLKDTMGAEQELTEVSAEALVEEPLPAEQQDPDYYSWPPIVDWDALKAKNSDAAGWIRIPGTSVDYPILTNSENEYYLHRNIYKSYSFPGSIFADYQNTNDLSQEHIVIYGHHMITDTMFHDVASYADKGFFDSHRTIYYETPETTYVLKTVAMYTVDPSESDVRKVLFPTMQDFQEYFDAKMSRNMTIRYDDYDRATVNKEVTLITCNNTGSARQIVECIVEQEYPTSMIPNVIARGVEDYKASQQ